MKVFKDIGYFLEYYIDGKYIGTTLIDQPDRDEIGYYGKQEAKADTDIKLQGKKTIKKGTNYYTRMYPLCGQKN
tara:strand:+ start:1904 stop:2125 length:222 start_codon:yes stop_codon:yes gene_type:complete